MMTPLLSNPLTLTRLRIAESAEAQYRRLSLTEQGFEVIGARIDPSTGKHWIIYRGETRIPCTPTSDAQEDGK